MIFTFVFLYREEFIKVYEELFHTNNIYDIQHAIDRIQAWKNRSNRLPVAIEASRELTIALLLYKVNQASNTVFEKQEEICRELSLAIVRFVNHITEGGQTREFARPIIVIAKEYGIPEWIVHLRHEITHSSIPAFDVLLRGVNTALQWLQERFWDVQIQTSPSKAQIISKKKFDIKEILQSYIKQRLKAVEAGYGIHGSQSLSKNTIVAFSQSAYKKELLCCLCDVGGLIPTDKQLQIFDIKSQDLVHTTDLSLPSILVLFWTPVLKLIKTLGYGVDLICDLIRNIKNSNILQTRLICGWIYQLTFKIENCTKKSIHMCLLPTETSCMVLGRIMHKPTVYTPLLVHHFNQQHPLNINVEKKLLDVLQMYHSIDDDDDVTDDLMDCGSIVASDDDTLLKDVHHIQDIVTSQTKHTGYWKLHNSDIDWSSVPLGCLPGQLLDCDDLEITVDTHGTINSQLPSYQPEQTTSSDHTGSSEFTRLKQNRTEKRFTAEQENYMKNKINSFIT
ncbi:hypothetical protein LOTGIDRAFT_229092 [Lottia gigantea]|uniref:Ribosomal biogenesis protein LAS1L n=1 Tax=Lottia gigantea TaxID=225164 RepID=V3ZXR2_LOTGI|nr:hypothetical protein LOTGIDRAFT_229092 [Lottia gigantea]ESO89197.1 hypothetical protein LOTGIDRAFT_229092 [Lottia gigantea]